MDKLDEAVRDIFKDIGVRCDRIPLYAHADRLRTNPLRYHISSRNIRHLGSLEDAESRSCKGDRIYEIIIKLIEDGDFKEDIVAHVIRYGIYPGLTAEDFFFPNRDPSDNRFSDTEEYERVFSHSNRDFIDSIRRDNEPICKFEITRKK